MGDSSIPNGEPLTTTPNDRKEPTKLTGALYEAHRACCSSTPTGATGLDCCRDGVLRPAMFRGADNAYAGCVITSAVVTLFAHDAEAASAFFRDVLELPCSHTGEGWLRFLPPTELSVHSGGDPARPAQAVSGVRRHRTDRSGSSSARASSSWIRSPPKAAVRSLASTCRQPVKSGSFRPGAPPNALSSLTGFRAVPRTSAA